MPTSTTAFWRKPLSDPVSFRAFVRKNRLSLGPVLGVVLLACSVGCKKPDADLGLEVLPGEPLGLATDTAQLHAFTYLDSAVQTSGLTRNLLGSYVDPDFGLLKAGMVAQVRLTANNIGQGMDTSGLVADSIVLALAFETPNTHYGNLNAQRFVVQELSTGLSVDSVYHCNDEPSVLTEDLVALHGGEIVPNPLANAVVGDDTLAPQLRIPLRMALAERILNAFGTADLVDNTAFLSFFKGIAVSVGNGVQGPFEGGILHFNTTSGASKITVYYRDQLNAPDVPKTLDLVMTSSSARYTVVERDRAQAWEPGLEAALSDTDAPSTSIYLQTLGGYRTALRFPDLATIAGTGRALSKAELVIPVAGAYYPYYAPPAVLFLFREVNGADVFLPDQLNGISGIGGEFKSPEQAYRFNITRYVSQVLNGTLPGDGLALVAGSTGVSANRAVLCGPAHPDTPMRLLLTFTTY